MITKHSITVSIRGKKHKEIEVDCELEPCPFCGSTDIELGNTHTPYCCAECLTCGAEIHGECFGKGKIQVANYYAACKSAVKAWNRRT